MATKEQIRRIYGMGAVLGIKGSDKDDLLHDLVFGITGKTSVKELEDTEAQSVIAELIHRMQFGNPNRPKKSTKNSDGSYGMATKEQQNLCWRYCYRLKELDPNPNSADVYDRLAGAIRKVCGTNIIPKKDPFHSVTQESCTKLIEQLKRYVNTAERRTKRQGDKHEA